MSWNSEGDIGQGRLGGKQCARIELQDVTVYTTAWPQSLELKGELSDTMDLTTRGKNSFRNESHAKEGYKDVKKIKEIKGISFTACRSLIHSLQVSGRTALFYRCPRFISCFTSVIVLHCTSMLHHISCVTLHYDISLLYYTASVCYIASLFHYVIPHHYVLSHHYVTRHNYVTQHHYVI